MITGHWQSFLEHQSLVCFAVLMSLVCLCFCIVGIWDCSARTEMELNSLVPTLTFKQVLFLYLKMPAWNSVLFNLTSNKKPLKKHNSVLRLIMFYAMCQFSKNVVWFGFLAWGIGRKEEGTGTGLQTEGQFVRQPCSASKQSLLAFLIFN